ncbi:MAG: hypothetical protein COB20_06840 [SAR86 cluster bacterium]|uniref:Tail specific protease domain-containing protein n=1 Tax=SAR86 cluster bacterium TaxID=2030880 RepID=A0A2A4X6V3_9GAMM|nr:MAG: hypothetical protein COB20_06840 [SAR86 cluster bacterium]
MPRITISKHIVVIVMSMCMSTLECAEITLTQNLKNEVISKVIEQMEDKYILPDRGLIAANELRSRSETGYFDGITDSRTFANRLTHVLDTIDDWHIWVNYYPNPIREDYVARQPSLDERIEQAALIRRRNFGFEKIERLVGNIGYIDYKNFYFEEEESERALSNAMELISHTSGLIIRLSGGGDPRMVELFLSYLLEEKTHVGSIVYRDQSIVEENWTWDEILGPHYGTERPIYLLINEETFSAAEAFTYVLTNRSRATTVGETTIGGAHPSDTVRIHKHFMMSVPVARSISPITGTNWQNVGIRPDYEVVPDVAFDTAYKLILEELISNSEDSAARSEQEYALRILNE